MDLRGIDSEELYTRADILEEMDKHNKVFNLDTFYVNDPSEFTPNYTGYRIITSDKEYSGYCYPYSISHESAIECVLFALYGDEYNKIYRGTKYNFRETSALLGAIFIQMLSKHYTLVWIPDSINEFQYNCILKFFNEMDVVNKRLDEDIVIKVSIRKSFGIFSDYDVSEVIDVLPDLVRNERVI